MIFNGHCMIPVANLTLNQCERFVNENLEKARVIIAGIVPDRVPFMEQFGLKHHHHTHEQQNTMKQDHATIHQQLGLIQVLDGLFTPALEDLYQALKISIAACGGEFHEFVAQLHGC